MRVHETEEEFIRRLAEEDMKSKNKPWNERITLENLGKLSKRELQIECEQNGIFDYHGKTKDQMIEQLIRTEQARHMTLAELVEASEAWSK